MNAAGQQTDVEENRPSGIAEVIRQATGLSPGQAEGASALLALGIAATVLWAVAYLWRRRRLV